MKKHLLHNHNMKHNPEKSSMAQWKTGKNENPKNQKFQNFQNPKNQKIQNFRTRGLTPSPENQKNENLNHAIFTAVESMFHLLQAGESLSLA